MTLIPKSIANENLGYLKILYKIKPIVFIIILLIVFVLIFIFPPFIALFVFLLMQFLSIVFFYDSIAYEIIDDGDGLNIKTLKYNEFIKISYSDIINIDYKYSYFIFKNNVVTLFLKSNSKLGQKVHFISWADSCNYQKEFNINPFVKTPETLAWITQIKEKINE